MLEEPGLSQPSLLTQPSRETLLQKLEHLKAPGALLNLFIPILGVEDARLLAGTLPQWAAHAFLGILKGTALVFPSQKPEPGIETGVPEKVTRTSAQCGLSVVNRYLQSIKHSAGHGTTRVNKPWPRP